MSTDKEQFGAAQYIFLAKTDTESCRDTLLRWLNTGPATATKRILEHAHFDNSPQAVYMSFPYLP